jgi:hypothetical protein
MVETKTTTREFQQAILSNDSHTVISLVIQQPSLLREGMCVSSR